MHPCVHDGKGFGLVRFFQLTNVKALPLELLAASWLQRQGLH